RANAIGPLPTARNNGVSRVGVTASAVGSGKRRSVAHPQLTRPRRPRASAQQAPTPIFQLGRVIDPGAMPFSSSRTPIPPNIFVRRCADWRYGASWIGRRAIGNGGAAGDGNGAAGVVLGRTRREACLCLWEAAERPRKVVRTPKRRKERAGPTGLRSPV